MRWAIYIKDNTYFYSMSLLTRPHRSILEYWINLSVPSHRCLGQPLSEQREAAASPPRHRGRRQDQWLWFTPSWAENAGVFSGRLALRDPLCWTAHFTGRGEPGAHLNSNLPMNSRSTPRWEFVSWGWSRADMMSPRLGPGDTAPPHSLRIPP